MQQNKPQLGSESISNATAGIIRSATPKPPPRLFPGRGSAQDKGAEHHGLPVTSNAGRVEHSSKAPVPVSGMPLPTWRGSITMFDGISATLPSESFEDLDWTAFASKICSDEPTFVTDKKDALYFLACQLRDAPLTAKTLEHAEKMGKPTVGKMRSMDHVTESQVLIYDYDGIEEAAFGRICSYLEKQGLTYVAYTTFSHGREDKPGMHVRVCLPVDQPLDVDTYFKVWHVFAGLLAEMLDGTEAQVGQGGA